MIVFFIGVALLVAAILYCICGIVFSLDFHEHGLFAIGMGIVGFVLGIFGIFLGSH